MKHCFLLVSVLFIVGCATKSSKELEIEKIPIDITLERFDNAFGKATIHDIPALKEKYPLFFPKQYHDSIWEQKINDTLQQQLYKEVAKTFPSEDILIDDLHSLFQHIKYYFPQYKAPLVYTIISDVDYQNKITRTDSLLIIALDTYLGSEHPFYEGIPAYIVNNLKKSQVMPDVASAYAKQFISKPRQRTLLAQMIYYGKELYLKELWLPAVSDAMRIGYTNEQYQWATENEIEIWRNFIENEVLYSTDPKLIPRFINPAPFSKFYLEIDNESPGMIARYIGWKIVDAYMKNNNTSVQQLMIKNAEDLFKESKYKPAK